MSRQSLMAKYADIKSRRAEGEEGFTLIELLVVVVIIGILVAIAIPLYLHFENGAKTSGAESDAHGITNLVKLCQSDNGGTLPGDASAAAGALFSFTGTTACASDTYNLSNGDSATYTANNGNGGWTVTVTNADSGKTATYTSQDGKTALSG